MAKNDSELLIEGGPKPPEKSEGSESGGVESAQVDVLTRLSSLNVAAAVESERGFSGMRDMVEGVEGAENHPRLIEVADFFDGMIVEMGLQDGGFFKSPELIAHFQKRLEVFLSSLDDKIRDLKAMVQNLGSSLVLYYLPDNWEEVLRKACYMAFFVHLGQKRAGEKDENGDVQDYICHPMRVLFKHTINKQHEFSLRRWIVAILHDTREDIHKGFLKVMTLEGENLPVEALDGKQNKDQAKQRSEQAIGILRRQEGSLQMEYGNAVVKKAPYSAYRVLGQELTVSEGLDILTNDTGDRGKGILHMFQKAFELADAGSMSRLLSALGDVLQIKNAGDRVDNVRTSGTKGSALKVQAETLHIFCRLCQEFGMLNIADWHFDYLYAVGHPEEYREIMRMRRDADFKWQSAGGSMEALPATEAFAKEFLFRLRAKSRNPDLNLGRDFILIFRPVGQRFRGLKEAKADLGNHDAAKDLRNYVIFYPVANRESLSKIACEVFREMTEEGFDDDIYYHEPDRTALGREMVDNNGPISPSEKFGAVGNSDHYGTVVWRSFMSEEAAAFSLLGYPYVIEKYGFHPTARKLKLGLHGNDDLDLDDLKAKFALSTDKIRLLVEGLDGDYKRVDEFLEGKDPKLRDLFYDYMHQKVMTMFLEKTDVVVNIPKEGADSAFVNITVPKALSEVSLSSGDYESLLAYARPELLGRIRTKLKSDGSRRFSITDEPPDLEAWAQAMKSSVSALDGVLRGERNKLLFEEFPD